jgi:glycosyltransferase involved in cell wall biosynthesis
VFYTWGENSLDVYDPDFQHTRSWDIDLLDGYDYVFVRNTSSNPGSHHFKGIVNPDLIDQLDNYQPSIIIVYGWKYNSHLSVLRYFKGKATIYFRGDSHLLDRGWLNLFKKYFKYPLLKWVYSHVDYALSPGKAAYDYFKFFGFEKSRIVRMVHSVDNQRFMNLTQEQMMQLDDWKKKLQILKNDFVFMFAGKLESKKNPELLIRAFLSVHEKYPNTKLLILGSGKLESNLKAEYQNNDSSPFIQFIPFANQSLMPLAYRLANTYVLPSQGPEETWGLSVNEALASGIPSIVSNRCGCYLDLITPGVNGFVFNSNDENDLYQKMILAIDRFHASSLSTSLLPIEFSLENSASQLLEHISAH